MAASLAIKNLSRNFGALKAIDDLSLEIPELAVAAFVGANGAGKTTTFSVIAGFLRANSGTIEISGEDVRAYRRRGGRMGLLPQDVQFYDERSIYRQLKMFALLEGLSGAAADAEVDRVLELAHLTEKAKEKPGALSRGMKARLGVAQALIGDPPIIILDEPTAGLDPRMLAEFRKTIDRLRGRSTIVISSHDLSELETLCDYVCMIDHGKLVRQGPLREMLGASSTVVYELESALTGVEDIAEKVAPWKVRLLESNKLEVSFDPREHKAADVNAAVLKILLESGAAIRNVRSERTLEQSYFEATDKD